MKTHHIEKVLDEEGATVAIGGTEHSVVRKDRVGCLLRTTGGRAFEDYYSYTELARIEEDGLLSIWFSLHPDAARPRARNAPTGRERELVALFAAQYDDPTRPTVNDIHRALAAEIWSINNDLPDGEATLKVPSLSTVQRAVAKLMSVTGFGRRRAGRTYRGF